MQLQLRSGFPSDDYALELRRILSLFCHNHGA